MPSYSGSTPITPIQGIFGNYPVRTFKPVNFGALALLTGMEPGDSAVIPGNGATFVYYGGWVQTAPARFTSTALRDSAYATAGGAYRVPGAQAIVGAITSQWSGTAWKAYNSEWVTFAPVLTPQIVLGTGGTSFWAWRYSNGLVKIKFCVRLGVNGTWTLPQVQLPVPIELTYIGNWTQIGVGTIGTGSDFAPTVAHFVDAATGVRFYSLQGSPVKFGVISPSSPIQVADGITLSGMIEYTAAA
jgi:hypothetical protein